MTEHRKTHRVNKKVKSEVRTEEAVTLSSSVDVSKGGIFISTPEPLNNGSTVNLTIMLPGNGEVEVQGVVRWVREDETDSGKAGMGIEFVNISGDLARKLEGLLE
ncbi:MAG TPA: PilZ domain-containing protein [Spirochaetota bacterium]|nr:PilZ domain-containing protein [Spirochaetota bacterium]HPF05966.1 PilZ domain-containing protein [Spirochaetota bacterium]HPJ42590.1 PilZ domain-containing protein [Spirochaetota bacterium]HPR37376.1 PilZ domain-containing protein [Spirochaetota bacterium]HRX47169.1 PilZ domain-containing protein [Spirochaetota bacterium]